MVVWYLGVMGIAGVKGMDGIERIVAQGIDI